MSLASSILSLFAAPGRNVGTARQARRPRPGRQQACADARGCGLGRGGCGDNSGGAASPAAAAAGTTGGRGGRYWPRRRWPRPHPSQGGRRCPTVGIVATAASPARHDLFALVLRLLVFIKSVHKLFLVQQFSPAPCFLVAEFPKLLQIRRIFPH